MNFVYHDISEIAEKRRDRGVLLKKQRFKGFRCYLQNPGRVFEELRLVRRTHVSVPVPDGYIRFFAELYKAAELMTETIKRDVAAIFEKPSNKTIYEQLKTYFEL